MERTDFKIVNAFVSKLDIRVSVVLTQMVKNELYHARQTVDALHILNETLYSVEQKFKLERIEELEHDIRDARKRLDSALDEKVKLDERVKIMENQQRILHQEYDAILNSDQQKEKELEKQRKNAKNWPKNSKMHRNVLTTIKVPESA
jgi:septal ring factor EnvC (AmiA/AmiB activator)